MRVEAIDVSKQFVLQRDRDDSVGRLLRNMLPRHRKPKERFWALRGVSFSLPEEQSMGIIGPNGSGKSTMLKILTRTMRPTSGRVAVSGRVSALVELGAGFHPDFTGRENVYLNASLFRISHKEMDSKFKDIVDFSGVAEFIDTPVKYYSSGMNARLGFSVAIHTDPELLIVDEVLAVGDQSFQEVCLERIRSMKRSGVSIILVSHSLSWVEELMDQTLWLDHGNVMALGDSGDVVAQYRSAAERAAPNGGTTDGRPVGLADIHAFVTPDGHLTISFSVTNESNGPTSLVPHVRLHHKGGLVVSELRMPIEQSMDFAPGRTELEVTVPVDWLPPGDYGTDVLMELANTGRDVVSSSIPVHIPRHLASAVSQPRWRRVGG